MSEKNSHEGGPRKSLAALDDRLQQDGVVRVSLDPGRIHARSFTELAQKFRDQRISPGLQEALEDLIEALAVSIPRNFPQNLLWDFEGLCGALIRCAESAPSSAPEYLREATRLLQELMETFGQHSLIRFRYLHDFIYGYDFEQWTPPYGTPDYEQFDFSMSFLQAMLEKGRSMQRCAARDGAAYPRLPTGEYRNTFSFCREPESEQLLFTTLVARGLLPLEGWRLDGYTKREKGKLYRPGRVACAMDLGLCDKKMAKRGDCIK